MDITLISKSFQTNTTGLGSYSKMVYECIKDEEDFNINLLFQKQKQKRGISTMKFSFVEIPLQLMKKRFKYGSSDVYHILNPLESFYFNPKKSVVTIHDFIPIHYSEEANKFTTITKIIYKKALNKSIKFKNIIVTSQETADVLKLDYNVDDDNINIIKYAIDDKYHPKFIKNDIFTIGTVSVLESRKRIDILIEAFLEANIENSQLLIGGSGGMKTKLKELANNDSRIKFLGFIPDEKMVDFYNSLDVFVFPTILEGYGLPIVEAMACGKPVITLEDGFIPSDLKKRTFISSKSNLANDLKNKNFKCDIENNLKFAKEEHSLNKMGQKLKKIYYSMI
ncbi:MAG: glycosyltransferase [Methanobrevibacter sp.]|nr:glycosyltransferase [Methanobrevibacter sp.]